MDLSEELVRQLIEAARAARERAYAPYSRFPVGAALLAEDGTIYTGCNVEISSFSLTCCAERVALFSAVAAGRRTFRAIAVVGGERIVPPCGACRQALAEFNGGMQVILASTDGSYRIESLAALYPEPFSTEFLPR